jgi:uncharacterized protein (TIGR02246 family)
VLLGFACAGETRAETSCAPIDTARVAAFFDEWNLALASLKAEAVAKRYWPDAVLLPTLSNTPRTDTAGVEEYFEHFLSQRPRGRILTRTVQLHCNVAVDAGTYAFSLMDDNGHAREVRARYTYVYAFRDGAWKIAHHHSSAMPELVDSAPKPPAPAPVVHMPPPVGGTRLFLNADASPPIEQFYARGSRRKEEAVAVQVCTDAAGIVQDQPRVVQSSGSDALDQAAQAWARAARWVPATNQSKTIPGCAEIRVVFPREA